MLNRPVTSPGVGSPYCVVGFVAGDKADVISSMVPQEALQRFVDQLDEVFGTPQQPKPASGSFREGKVVDWGKEKYVRGGYSYPSYGAEAGDREALAAPVAGVLFWAGEATNTALNPCIQGALDTGERAMSQISAALCPAASKL